MTHAEPNAKVASPALRLSVVICTRDRTDTLVPAIESILADGPSDTTMELLIVDQGRDGATRQALAPLLARDSRLRHVASATVGLSAARNVGCMESRGEIIAFTDDDCTVEPGWHAHLLEVFDTHPDAGLVFGYVVPGPHDPALGILPDFKAADGRLTREQMAGGSGCWGMGANMAIRRGSYLEIGPFDEALGAGAPLVSAEDCDYILRAVCNGIGVYQCSRARVIHYGFRPRGSASKLMKGYAFGKGAMYSKFIRCRSWLGITMLLMELKCLARDMFRSMVRVGRPVGANALLYLFIGLWRGFRLPMEQASISHGPTFQSGSHAMRPAKVPTTV